MVTKHTLLHTVHKDKTKVVTLKSFQRIDDIVSITPTMIKLVLHKWQYNFLNHDPKTLDGG
jgi:hypothetical protein